MHLRRIYFFNIKFCEIFQGFIKKISGLFQGFQGFPGLQTFSRVFQDFQGPYEPCKVLRTSENITSFVVLKGEATREVESSQSPEFQLQFVKIQVRIMATQYRS